MDRNEVIKELKWVRKVNQQILDTDAKDLDIESAWVQHWKNVVEALDYALSSLETDEAYHLEYEKPLIIDWNNCHTDEQLKQALLEGFIAYAKDKFGVELIPKKSDNPDTVEKLFYVMREPTPEEYAAMNKLIKNMSYDTGVTFKGLYNHETYVPMSKINEMRSEIKNEVEEIYVWENDAYAIGEIEMGKRILDIVDKYLRKEQAEG